MARPIVVVAGQPLLGEIVASIAGEGREVVGAPTFDEARLIAELDRPAAVVFEAAAIAGREAEAGGLVRAITAAGARLGGGGGSFALLDEVPAGSLDAVRAWVATIVARPPTELTDPLELLRASYGEGLAAKARELAGKIDAGLVDAGAVEDARRLAHRLRGSSGTYGFPAFGELAGGVEDAILTGGEAGRARLVEARRRLDRWAPVGGSDGG